MITLNTLSIFVFIAISAIFGGVSSILMVAAVLRKRLRESTARNAMTSGKHSLLGEQTSKSSKPVVLRISNLAFNHIPMLLIKLDPSFSDQDFGDPFTHPELTLITNQFVHDMDEFIRRAINKIISPDSLAFFVDTNAPLPMVDLEVTFYTPLRRRLKVLFKQRVIASALVSTTIEKTPEGAKVSNTIREETI